MDVNAKLAEKQLTYQVELLKNKPAESRKNFTVIGWFVILFFFLFLFFFGFCVQTGHEDFAIKVFAYIMYAVTTVAGYWAGKKSEQNANRNKSDDTIDDAGIID